MAKNTVPALKYDAELTSGSIQNAMKAVGGEKVATGEGSVYRVPHTNLRILPGFNIRVQSGDYEDQVEDLMKSIRAEGFKKDRPLTGFAAKDESGDFIAITDGHRRLEAVNRLVNDAENPMEIGPLPVIMGAATATLEDHLVGLLTSNSGNPLTMFEKALLAKRLDNIGVDHKRIAERLGFTPRHLINMLKLSGAPAKIRNAIIDGKISATEALNQMKAKGKDAGDAVEKGIADAEAAGKKKATAKNIAGTGDSTTGDDGDDTDKSSVVTKGGKVHETVQVVFKKGSVVPADTILPFARFKGSDWWNWVDSKKKTHAVIEYDIKIIVKMITAAEDAATEDGDDTKVEDAETAADESFEVESEAETAADAGAEPPVAEEDEH